MQLYNYRLVMIFLIVILFFTFLKNNSHLNRDLSPEAVVLSKLINSEADQSDTLDMQLVGSTVLNRVDHSDFPNNIFLVVEEYGQYSGFQTPQYKRSELSDSIAVQLLRGEGRNCDVLYFFNYKMDAAPYFVNWLRRDRELIFKNNHHEFY